MASSPTTGSSNVAYNGGNGNYGVPLTILTSLFFMWGFITCMNDILIPHLKAIFEMSYTQTMLIQFTFFGAYALMSLPSGWVVERIGYKNGIVVGLTITGVGALMFYPAAGTESYAFFLAGFFVLASGITLLQVAANPFVAILGTPETASSRLNMTQAFNSLGTTIAPVFGAFLILSEGEGVKAEVATVQGPYIGIALALFAIAAFFMFIKLPQIENASDDSVKSGSAWGYRHLVLGAGAIFLYVGAEVSIGSFMINFFGEDFIAGLSESEAAKYVALYWGGAMIGRFFGAVSLSQMAESKRNMLMVLIVAFGFLLAWYLSKEIHLAAIFLIFIALNVVAFKIGVNKPARTLAVFALVNVLLVASTVMFTGHVAMWTLIAVGLFNSIMFPTIFTLAIDGLGEHTGQGSGILCAAIVGGAIVPLLMGYLADTMGIQYAFLITVLCYAYIAYYGFKGYMHTHSAKA